MRWVRTHSERLYGYGLGIAMGLIIAGKVQAGAYLTAAVVIVRVFA